MARKINSIIYPLPMLNEHRTDVLGFIGPIDTKYLSDLSGSLGWRYANFHGRPPQVQVFDIFCCVDYWLVVLSNSADFRFTSPTASFEESDCYTCKNSRGMKYRLMQSAH